MLKIERQTGHAIAKMMRQAKDRTPPEILRAFGIMQNELYGISPRPVQDEMIETVQDPEKLLEERLEELRLVRNRLPETVVLIPDGNRRYAKEQKMTEKQGHDLGARVLYNGLKVFDEFKEVKNIILWAWSEDNEVKRPDEKANIFGIMAKYLDEYTPDLTQRNVRIKRVGRKDRLSISKNGTPLPEGKRLRESLAFSEWQTRRNTGTNVIVGIDYGENVEDMSFERNLEYYRKAKFKSGSREGASGVHFPNTLKYRRLFPDELAEIRKTSMLIPEPDLVVRTSGELRLSKFPYGSHAEIVVVDTNLPAIMPHDIAWALLEYTKRDRRGGR